MTRTEDRLRATFSHVADKTRTSPDVLAVLAARNRRRHLRRYAPAIAAAAAVAVAFTAVVELNRTPAPIDVTSGADPGTAGSGGFEGWGDVSLDEAIDRLIAVNEGADPRPVAGDGEVLVDRTYALWTSTTVGADESTHVLELTLHEVRTAADGTQLIVREPLAAIDPSDDPAALRRVAQQHLDGFDPSSVAVGSVPVDVSSEHASTAPGDGGDLWLDRLERDSRGSLEPRAGSTERPDQVRAWMSAEEALQNGLEPEERIAVLEAIDRLDRSLLEYRGPVLDLLGREGVGIAGTDDGVTTVLIFDPATGDLLGTLTVVPPDTELDWLPIPSYSARETVLEENRS